MSTEKKRVLRYWPTPRASDATHGGPNQRDKAGNYALPGAVHHAEIALNPLTSSAAGSPARTYRSPGKGQDLKDHGLVFGGSFTELLANYDPDLCSLKMSQRSLFEEESKSLPRLPRSGSMRNGTIYQQQPSAPLTGGTESSLWPTPTVQEAISNHGYQSSKGRDYPTLTGATGAAPARGGRLWPPPTTRDHKDGTAQACANVPVNGLLGRAVHQWPTPCQGDYRSPNLNPAKDGQAEPASGHALPARVGGQLNPSWVTWLMGFPLNWLHDSQEETVGEICRYLGLPEESPTE